MLTKHIVVDFFIVIKPHGSALYGFPEYGEKYEYVWL
jgi:hypothetical protein